MISFYSPHTALLERSFSCKYFYHLEVWKEKYHSKISNYNSHNKIYFWFMGLKKVITEKTYFALSNLVFLLENHFKTPPAFNIEYRNVKTLDLYPHRESILVNIVQWLLYAFSRICIAVRNENNKTQVQNQNYGAFFYH